MKLTIPIPSCVQVNKWSFNSSKRTPSGHMLSTGNKLLISTKLLVDLKCRKIPTSKWKILDITGGTFDEM
jgi:hypothetical protein